MPAHADEFQSARTIASGGFIPLDAARQNLRSVDKSLDIINDRRLREPPDRPRERRLVARFGAVAFDGLDQRAFFTANVTARTDKQPQIEVQAAAQNIFPQQAGAIRAPDLFA